MLAELAGRGIRLVDPAPDGPRVPGLVFFSEITPALMAFLSSASSVARAEIIAVAVRDGPNGDGSSAWGLLETGVSDVVTCVDPALCATGLAERLERWETIGTLLESESVKSRLVGGSPKWTGVLRQLIEIGAFTSASVLITGESGTGKEMAARLLHDLDRRPNKGRLVLVDCTTVVPELSGSEFFGHEKGAFTGAIGAREGAFELADDGTLFLDEVGELPPALQAQLLRVVQEGTYKRVGSNVWRQTKFRLICATNRDLSAEQANGAFRRDLYYRIATTVCKMPALRERPEDILPLARHFLRSFTDDAEADFDEAVCMYLLTREYAGNIRDLRQLIARISYRRAGRGLVTVGHVPEDERLLRPGVVSEWRDEGFRKAVRKALSTGAGLKAIGRAAEDLAEDLALEQEEGNVQRAARRLGVTDRALQLRRAARRQLRPGGETMSQTA